MQPDARAKALSFVHPVQRASNPPARSTDWSAYAKAYDLLSEHNPAYRELLSDFEAFLGTIEAPRVVCDVGGGTGNYATIVARAFPGCEIRFVEPDEGMVRLAQAKLASHANITYETTALENVTAQGDADLVVCVHALYAMPDQQERLADLHRLLRPGGYLYLVDLGREMNVPDWRRYLFAEIRKRHGLLNALKVFWRGREIARQNRAIFDAQQTGAYWTHTGEEMAQFVDAAGFDVLRQAPAYRGYSDLIVCQARG